MQQPRDTATLSYSKLLSRLTENFSVVRWLDAGAGNTRHTKISGPAGLDPMTKHNLIQVAGYGRAPESTYYVTIQQDQVA